MGSSGKRKEVNQAKEEAMAKLKAAEEHRLKTEEALKMKEDNLRKQLEAEKQKMLVVMEQEEKKRRELEENLLADKARLQKLHDDHKSKSSQKSFVNVMSKWANRSKERKKSMQLQ